MVYADYTYYKNDYCGIMDEAEFNRLSRQASAYLDQVTFDRIESGWEGVGKLSDRIRMACCAVADVLYEQSKGGEITSASNDGYSESYATSGKTTARKQYDAVFMYLGRTHLMYQGV